MKSMKKMLLTLSVITAMLVQALAMPAAVSAEEAAEEVTIFFNTEPKYMITDYASSNLSVSKGRATCSSKLTSSDKTTKITATQYLEKRSGTRWSISKVWIKTVSAGSISMTNTCAGVSDGTFRLRTVFKVTNGKITETITKLSSYKTVSKGIIIADEEPADDAAENIGAEAKPQKPDEEKTFEEMLAEDIERLRAMLEDYREENPDDDSVTDEFIEQMISTYTENAKKKYEDGTYRNAVNMNDASYRERYGSGIVYYIEGKSYIAHWTLPHNKILTDNKGVLSGGAVYEYDPELKRLIIDGCGSFSYQDYSNLYASFDCDYIVIGRDVLIPPNMDNVSQDEGIGLNNWIMYEVFTSIYQPQFIVYEGSDFMEKYDETSRYGFEGDEEKIQNFITSHEVVVLPENADIHDVVYDKERLPRSVVQDIDESSYFAYAPEGKRVSVIGLSDEPAVLDLDKLVAQAVEYMGDFTINAVDINNITVPGYENDKKGAEEYLLGLLRKSVAGAEDKYSVRSRRELRYVEYSKHYPLEFKRTGNSGTLDSGVTYRYYPENKVLVFDGKGEIDYDHVITVWISFTSDSVVFGKDVVIKQSDLEIEHCFFPFFTYIGKKNVIPLSFAAFGYKNNDFTKKYNAAVHNTADINARKNGTDFEDELEKCEQLYNMTIIPDDTDISAISYKKPPYKPVISGNYHPGGKHINWKYDPYEKELSIEGYGYTEGVAYKDGKRAAEIVIDELMESIGDKLNGCEIVSVRFVKYGGYALTVAGYEDDEEGAAGYIRDAVVKALNNAAEENEKPAEAAAAEETTEPVITANSMEIPVNAAKTEYDNFVWGDTDLNGTVGLSDAIMLGKSLMLPSVFPLSDQAAKQSDVVKDNVINTLDMNKLTEHLLGKISGEQLAE